MLNNWQEISSAISVRDFLRRMIDNTLPSSNLLNKDKLKELDSVLKYLDSNIVESSILLKNSLTDLNIDGIRNSLLTESKEKIKNKVLDAISLELPQTSLSTLTAPSEAKKEISFKKKQK